MKTKIVSDINLVQHSLQEFSGLFEKNLLKIDQVVDKSEGKIIKLHFCLADFFNSFNFLMNFALTS